MYLQPSNPSQSSYLNPVTLLSFLVHCVNYHDVCFLVYYQSMWESVCVCWYKYSGADVMMMQRSNLLTNVREDSKRECDRWNGTPRATHRRVPH